MSVNFSKFSELIDAHFELFLNSVSWKSFTLETKSHREIWSLGSQHVAQLILNSSSISIEKNHLWFSREGVGFLNQQQDIKLTA